MRHAVVVHEPLRLHRADLGRSVDAVRSSERGRSDRAASPARLPIAPELPLRERPEGDDAIGVSTRDRRVGECHRGAGAVAPAAKGLSSEPEIAHAERGAQSHWLVALHVRDDAVDVAHLQSRVLHRVADRDARQLELARGRAAPLVVRRFADADDDCAAVHYRPCTTGRTRGLRWRRGSSPSTRRRGRPSGARSMPRSAATTPRDAGSRSPT